MILPTLVYHCLTRYEVIPWLTRLNRRDGADKVIRHPNTPPESQLRIQEATPQISHTSASSAAPADPWETDLIAFLQEHRGGTENDLARKEAQEFADKLDTVHHPVQRLNWTF